MIILGISEEHDAGVSIIEDGNIIFAVNEERFTRKKGAGGFPVHSLNAANVFLRAQGKTNSLQGVALASLIHVHQGAPESYDPKQKRDYDFGTTMLRQFAKINFGKWVLNQRFFTVVLRRLLSHRQKSRCERVNSKIQETLKLQVSKSSLEVIDHHYCHAYSAYYTSGFNDSLVLTFDAQGDAICSRFFWVKNGNFEELKYQPFFVSVGYFYFIITVILGFKGGQEGKVTGLSARGEPSQTYSIIKERLLYHSEHQNFECNGLYYMDEITHLKAKLAGFCREDIAAGMQYLLEEYITQYISDLMHKFQIPKIDLCLAGGVFANVLLNNRINRIEKIKRLFIHPHMGDGGLATGAALYMAKNKKPAMRSVQLNSTYLGTEYTNEFIEQMLKYKGIKYQHLNNPEELVGELLSTGNIVCLYQGRMEYGPRALGNRTIMASPSDPGISQTLNNKLCRSDFMPFAPSVLEEHAPEFFNVDLDTNLACEFMTMVVECTDICRERAPAIVHVDGTARPHIVKKSVNPRYHKIISTFYNLTGTPLILNTSFNMHDEPIVECPETALNSFLRSSIDFLLVGDFLIAFEENAHLCP